MQLTTKIVNTDLYLEKATSPIPVGITLHTGKKKKKKCGLQKCVARFTQVNKFALKKCVARFTATCMKEPGTLHAGESVQLVQK